jgi:hypothetical protein
MWQVTGFVQIDYNSEMIKKLSNMSRIYKQLMMMSLDSQNYTSRYTLYRSHKANHTPH